MNFRRAKRESQPPPSYAATFTRCRLLLAVILSSLSLGFAVVLGWYLIT